MEGSAISAERWRLTVEMAFSVRQRMLTTAARASLGAGGGGCPSCGACGGETTAAGGEGAAGAAADSGGDGEEVDDDEEEAAAATVAALARSSAVKKPGSIARASASAVFSRAFAASSSSPLSSRSSASRWGAASDVAEDRLGLGHNGLELVDAEGAEEAEVRAGVGGVDVDVARRRRCGGRWGCCLFLRFHNTTTHCYSSLCAWF